jgi:hypothetical protein
MRLHAESRVDKTKRTVVELGAHWFSACEIRHSFIELVLSHIIIYCSQNPADAQRAKRRQCNLLVLSGGDVVDACHPDDLTLRDNRQTTLHRHDSLDGQKCMLALQDAT